MGSLVVTMKKVGITPCIVVNTNILMWIVINKLPFGNLAPSISSLLNPSSPSSDHTQISPCNISA